jgi:hypothetical protein
MDTEFPYNLPIWRSSHRAKSPNKKYIAEIDPAYEVSMGNPTYGTLKLSNGLSLPKCNPSFIWSDDSRYLAVPHYFTWCFLFRKQRMFIIDVEEHRVYASNEHTWYFQPESFAEGKLVATINPFHNPKNIEWLIPNDINKFKQLDVMWSEVPPNNALKSDAG